MSLEPILSNAFINSYKDKIAPWGFNGLGYIVYRRTYSRLKPDGTNEEWHETVARCVNGAQQIGAGYTRVEAERLYDHVFNLRCNFAGRMLWQLGTSMVERFGGNSLLNCWFASMNEPKAFLFLFENLMLGGGVGYSIRREDVHELPRVKSGVTVTHKATKDADFIVPDSREGWVKLLAHVLDAFYVTGKSFTYSTILIRSAGERINGFGGTASGPTILMDGIDKIVKLLQSREDKKLRSIDVLDICNIIGSVVVAGNVRRSAEIALGDPDDYLYIRAKNWSLGNVPNWRGMSNNTIYADAYAHISSEIWNNGYETDPKTGVARGEPYGFFNLPLSQRYGRLKDGPMKDSKLYPTDRDNCVGTNPCGEISLASYECCNLSELYLCNIRSEEELMDCAKLLYKTQKAIAALPFLHKETEEIVHRNMRLGLGVTGICQSLHKIEWLDQCYVELRRFDKEWSKQRGWPESIKLTTIKPSGTLSLLGGATPGVHPAYSKHYIRRVRMSSEDKLVKVCREAGYTVEYQKRFDGSDDHSTVVVEFPCETPEGAVFAKDMGVIQQLEMVKRLQAIWADNAVSVTAYYELAELETLKDWMRDNYGANIKSVSFLLKDDHGFLQAPYETIDEARYREMAAKVKPLDQILADLSGGMLDSIECLGGSCPVR
jgi:ribonucleoside-triphosphate reductase (thioredoxin)